MSSPIPEAGLSENLFAFRRIEQHQGHRFTPPKDSPSGNLNEEALLLQSSEGSLDSPTDPFQHSGRNHRISAQGYVSAQPTRNSGMTAYERDQIKPTHIPTQIDLNSPFRRGIPKSRHDEPPSDSAPSTRLLLNKMALKGDFPRLRSGKSLQQRLDVSETGQTPQGLEPKACPPSAVLLNPSTPRLRRSHTPRVDPAIHAIPVHSRSASVLSMRPDPDEDISSIMMRGATDLRNAKMELEDQRREIAGLRSQLTSTQVEKEQAMQRLNSVKEATKNGLEKSSKSLGEMQTCLEGLKAQSENSFAFVANAKSSLIDVKELRETVKENLQNLESLFDDSGHICSVVDTSCVIEQLQLECTNGRHVADLLRDRLQNLGAELCEARARITELEDLHVKDREALRSTCSSLAEANGRVEALAERLQQQHARMYDLLSTVADTQAKLSASEAEISRLVNEISLKDKDIQQLRLTETECARLTLLLEEKQARIEQLEPLRALLDEANKKANKHEVTIRGLETDLSSKQMRLKELETRLGHEEKLVRDGNIELMNLKESIKEKECIIESQDKIIQEGIARSKELSTKLAKTENQLEHAREEIESRTTKMHESDTRCQVMEERFEDVSINLKLAKQSLGEMQDRLIESEAKFARDIEAATGSLHLEIAVVNSEKKSLQDKIQASEEKVNSEKQRVLELQTSHKKQLEQQAEQHEARLLLAEQRAVTAENGLKEVRSELHTLQEASNAELNMMTKTVELLEHQLEEIKQSPESNDDELACLNQRLVDCNMQIAKLEERSKTLETRYRAGDLNVEEKTFISSLLQTSQSIHEQQLIQQGNELRRRDNTISELRSRLTFLESTLSKHLKTQVKQAAVVTEKRSLIDPTAWGSSDRGSSPHIPLAEAHSSEPENLPARASVAHQSPPNNENYLASRIVPQETDRPPVPPFKTPTPKTSTTPAAAEQQMGKALASTKPKFGKLARKCSDDIEEFDDPDMSPVGLGKRGQTEVSRAPNATKRLRTGTRNRPEGKEHEPQSLTSKASGQLAGTGAKTRGRRARR
ncbi:hypothetical protein K474DRAFT_1694784 [Panus rudis PR-1116 ss-1]|nr:hypothetical protein K474DRAFT_1694784 [Panus rudis PR-1116 ss-1]